MNTTKLYDHDCDNCVYVFTTHSIMGEDYDWYVCPQPGKYDTSVIARYADGGPNYWSCPAYMVRDHKYQPGRHRQQHGGGNCGNAGCAELQRVG